MNKSLRSNPATSIATARIVIAGASALSLLGHAQAQQSASTTTTTTTTAAAPAADPFAYLLGTSKVGATTYTVKATQPPASAMKSQKVRLIVYGPTAGGVISTRYLTMATGKYKTVAQLDTMLVEIFRHFLTGVPVNTEVGKIGDLKYGGEVHFVAVSPDVLRYDALTEGEPPFSVSFSRADVQALNAILGG